MGSCLLVEDMDPGILVLVAGTGLRDTELRRPGPRLPLDSLKKNDNALVTCPNS